MNSAIRGKPTKLVSSKSTIIDETSYLLKSKKNAARLSKGLKEYSEKHLDKDTINKIS